MADEEALSQDQPPRISPGAEALSNSASSTSPDQNTNPSNNPPQQPDDKQRSSWIDQPPAEKRHTIGGKRFSVTPLESDLMSFHETGSHDMSEEAGSDAGSDSDNDSEHSDKSAPSINSNLTDEESYAVDTDSDQEGFDETSIDGSKSSSKRMPFSQYQPEVRPSPTPSLSLHARSRAP